MKFYESSISNYWSAEPKIKEARKVFFEKGIIKRELLADELAFSWLRCKYKNTSSTETPSPVMNESRRIPIKQLKKIPIALNEIWIGLFDSNHQLKVYTGNPLLGQSLSLWEFNEASAGYNGIGSCFETEKPELTIGLEHYNDYLTQFVTIGIPYKDSTVGLILPLQIADDELLEKLLSISFDLIFDHGSYAQEDDATDCYFFRQDIQIFNNCYKQFSKLRDQNMYLKITASNAFGANLLAREIHQKSCRRDFEFVYLCEHSFERILSFDKWIKGFKGTIYIEDCRWLPMDFQMKVSKFIDSKLINSKASNHLYKSDVVVLTSEICIDDELAELPEEYAGLQMKFAKVNLIIPSFMEMGQQFKSYLYTEFERLCSKRWQCDYCLSEETLNLLKDYSWPEQYKELVYVVDYIVTQKFQGHEVPLTAMPAYILRAADNPIDKMSLRDLERLWIMKSLMKSKGNIKRTAEQLGITRTTLYKKIEDYQIKV